MSDVRKELAALFLEATLVGADYAPQLSERALAIVRKAEVEPLQEERDELSKDLTEALVTSVRRLGSIELLRAQRYQLQEEVKLARECVELQEAVVVKTKAEALKTARDCSDYQGNAIEALKEKNEQLAEERHWRNSWEKGGNGVLRARIAELKAGLLWALNHIHPTKLGVRCIECGCVLMRNPWGDPEPHADDCYFDALTRLAGEEGT